MRVRFTVSAALLSLAVCGVASPAGAATTAIKLTANPTAYTTGYVAASKYAQYYFSRYANDHYSICINTTSSSGDGNLYGSSSGYPTTSSYGTKSTNVGTEDDCIQYNSTSSGTYYLSVYGKKATNFNIYVIKDQINQVPTYMTDKLACPFNGGNFSSMYCGNLTSSTYGPIASPWGNADPASTPFFAGYQNYFHNGVDWAAPAGTQVYAAYGGTVKRLGDAGTGWGYYVVIEHNIDGNKFTTAYLHINSSGRPTSGSSISQYGKVGTIFDMNETGEVDHLHFAIKTGAYSTTSPTTWSGAMKYSSWASNASLFINPHTNNDGIYVPL